MSYDKSKVSPRPWKYSHLSEGHAIIFDADGMLISRKSVDNYHHAVHCVNTMDTLRTRVVALRDEAKRDTGSCDYSTGKEYALTEVLALLDELEGES